METSEAYSFESTYSSIPDTGIRFICIGDVGGVFDMESSWSMGDNTWNSFDDRGMFARNSTLLEKTLTEKESSFGKAFLLKKRFVCKDIRRAAWFRETRQANGIYFKAQIYTYYSIPSKI